jgi:hypothetical protein
MSIALLSWRKFGESSVKKQLRYFYAGIVISSLMFAGCKQLTGQISGEIPFLIDNPTSTVLKVNIDGKAIAIAPTSGHALTLKPGLHRLQSPLTQTIEFIVYDSKDRKGALINPTLSTYVLMQEVYAVDDKAAQHFGPIQSKIILDGVTFEGLLRTREGLFIDRDWHYDVHEDFPKEITVYGDQAGNIPDKLFNKTDFVTYFEANYGKPGTYARQRMAESTSTPDMHFEIDSSLPSFQNQKMEAAAKGLKSLYTRYLESTDAATLEKIRDDYFNTQMRFTQRYADMGADLKTEDREAYNALVLKVTELLSMDARVLPKKPSG